MCKPTVVDKYFKVKIIEMLYVKIIFFWGGGGYNTVSFDFPRQLGLMFFGNQISNFTIQLLDLVKDKFPECAYAQYY